MSSKLPATWARARIADLYALVGGGTPSTAEPAYWSGETPWITSADISSDHRVTPRRTVSQAGIANSATTKVPRGTLIVATRVGLGKTAVAPVELCFSQDCQGLLPIGQPLSSGFLSYQIETRAAELVREGRGTTISGITKAVLAAMVIDVAPLLEQQRIVEAIESYLTRLDNAVALLERVEENLKRYRASVLKAAVEGRLVPTEATLARQERRGYEPASELLKRILAERKTRWIENAAEKARAKAEERARKAGKPWTAEDNAATLEEERATAAKQYKEPAAPDTTDLPALPEGWCWTTIGECFDVRIGATPSRGVEEYWNGGVPWVSSGEVAFCRIRATRETISQVGLANTSTQLNPVGTVLIGMIGEGRTRGQVAILDMPACNNQNAAAIWVGATDCVPEYVYYYLMSQYEQTRRRGSGGNQPALNKARVQAIPLPLPPAEEQRRIAERIEVLFEVAVLGDAEVRHASGRGGRLRQAILKWAFRGKLVEQDLSDEPASALLERIKAQRAHV